MEELMIKIENVKKTYKLGQIGGTTLKDELQRLFAKIRKKEDPTRRIGSKNYNRGEKFNALNGVSFEVKKGEAIGLIGHNGAGKSTLLKLLSRVTAPTEGTISLNGRIASMLEVGTGFHAELTGRENIYMNGAILGMTKKEIDSKIEDIIDFSEVRQFIDTPVKRYSSGMYVKLAFSVAAHLDSEIVLMDEVLAVGDLNFQQKCIKKMREIADSGRTIVYVSHNMSTIRNLCDRVVVLDKGQVVFNGEVEEGISVYSAKNISKAKKVYENNEIERDAGLDEKCFISRCESLLPILPMKTPFKFKLQIESSQAFDNALLRLVLFRSSGERIGLSYSSTFNLQAGNNCIECEFDTSVLVFGDYFFDIVLADFNNEVQTKHDVIHEVLHFTIEETEQYYNLKWLKNSWGNINFPHTKIIN